MIMETDNGDTFHESENSLKDGYQSEDDMAPQHSDSVSNKRPNEEAEYRNGKENRVGQNHYNGHDYQDGVQSSDDGGMVGRDTHRMVSTDGEADNGEDGEILEDGEIASDQDVEINEEEEGETEAKPVSNKSSPNKPKGSHKDEERSRKGRNRKDRHSKRRRSKEDNHKDKQQKKKRHREYVDYDNAGDDFDQAWMPTDNIRKDKGDRKGDRSPPAPYHSPSQDSHGEERNKDGDKHRRGSGEGRYHTGVGGRDRDRGQNREHDRDKKGGDPRDGSRERPKDTDRRDKDKHDKSDRDKNKKERGDRHNRDSKDSRDKKNLSDGYDSPPGIYDSPSDEEFGGGNKRFGKKPKTMMSMVEGEYMDPSMITNDIVEVLPKNVKKKQQKKKEWQERRRQRELEFEDEAPVKKKPLLQTPMEERPMCRFFKEGKCQKGDECHFNHDFRPQKRLELCKFHIQNFCRNEETCVFMHGEFPCKYFHTGSTCYQGDNCKFSHDPLTEETEQALQHALSEREEHFNEEFEGFNEGSKKRYKKGLLGDMPAMSQEQIENKLEQMKTIPSIFDIETFAPGESPRKPGPGMGQSPSMLRPQGFYQDMSPNMRFNGPPNQGTPPRGPFMHGPGGHGMDGPPPGMQGPPPMGGPGLMGSGPPPGMPGMGLPQGQGMQGPPMGPPMNNQPMSQAAALVGAILRAAPMLQQYRGPSQPVTSMASMANSMNINTDPRYMGQNMGQNTNMMGQPQNMGQGSMLSPNQGMMSPGQDGMMGQGQPPMMGQGQQYSMMGQGQDGMMGQGQDNMDENMSQKQGHDNMGQQNQNLNQTGANSRDPRKLMNQMSMQEDRSSRPMDLETREDVDMRSAGSTVMGDVDLRQDVDLRHKDNNSQGGGNTTPQQDWDEDDDRGNNDIDDADIPSHLPPKQREMFLRIKQHTLIMNSQKDAAKKAEAAQPGSDVTVKMEDDKWYSSDEEDDVKPNISNILQTLNQPEIKQEPGVANSTPTSSINVMQMINAIKNSTTGAPTSTSTRDPRKQVVSEPKPYIPPREPTIINSREGDCSWRLCRVMYVKQRIPDNVDLDDQKFKNDPRVQKMLKLQELESGRVIDHSKTTVTIKKEQTSVSETKVPLLDPKIFQAKEPVLPRPELTPFIDPFAMKKENSNPRIKQEPVVTQRPMDPRLKQGPEQLVIKPMDPRVQRIPSSQGMQMPNPMSPHIVVPPVPSMSIPPPSMNIPPPGMNMPPPGIGMHNLPVRPMDPRISRQDSNSSINQSAMNPMIRPLDPRLARQNSRDGPPVHVNNVSRSSTPPMDPRQLNRQSSSDPRLTKTDALQVDTVVQVTKPLDPRLGRVMEVDMGAPLVQRQLSQPGTPAEKDAATEPPKPKIDYRNDPRFKRKHISESNLSPEIVGKPFTGQRKSSTEYSSPLGGESSKQEESSYNSYNRPRPAKPPQQNIISLKDNMPAPSTDITTHDILDSLQIMAPPVLEQPAPDKNLKDIFKTIDPTASPFC